MDFRGPYAGGPSESALAIHPPSLTAFGGRELVRAVEIALVMVVAVAMALLRRDPGGSRRA